MLIINPETLHAAEAAFRQGGVGAAAVLANADAMLSVGPFSVMQKDVVPPSGDKHDFMSLGPYWWPDPTTPDGLPYVRRDGYVNPEIERFDRPRLSQMADSVAALAAAAHLSGEAHYAARAAYLLRAWFLDPETRMHPHLRYGQAIRGHCEGRCLGIIDTECLARVVDAAVLLAGHAEWSAADRDGLRVWLAEYLDWLMTSPLGQAEAREANNHGTCYDVQVVALAMHTGRGELAKDVLAAVPERRIRTQVTPEGEQPRELARTRAWTYSLKNLCALLNLADWGRQLDVDVWGYRSDDGRCISRVVDWMMPFALGERPWKHPELGGFQGSAGFLVLARAGQFPGGERYAEALRGIGVAMDDLCLKLVAQCPLGAVGASGGRRGFH